MKMYIDKLENASILQQLCSTRWTLSMTLRDCDLLALTCGDTVADLYVLVRTRTAKRGLPLPLPARAAED